MVITPLKICKKITKCDNIFSMKMALIIYGSLDIISGGYFYDRKLLQALESAGHSVRVFTPQEAEGVSGTFDVLIIDELCHPHFWQKKHFDRLPSHKVRVALVHHLALEEGLGLVSHWRHRLQERAFFRYIDFCLYNSPQTQESVASKGGYRGPGVIALPGREDFPVPRDSVEKDLQGDLRLCVIGNIIGRKGIHTILQAMTLSPLRISLEIAGKGDIDPPYTAYLKRLISRGRLEDRVSFLGYINNQEKGDLLQRSHALVMPSAHEGFGIAYLEAMAYGCIPVASQRGGAGYFIHHKENGFLVTPGQPEELAGIFNELGQNYPFRKRLSIRAREDWENHPTWSQTFNDAIKALETL